MVANRVLGQLAGGDQLLAGIPHSATQAPVIEAQRVPPSACSTSQSERDLALPERLQVDDGA